MAAPDVQAMISIMECIRADQESIRLFTHGDENTTVFLGKEGNQVETNSLRRAMDKTQSELWGLVTESADSAELARKWAANPEGVAVLAGFFSALHYAAKAQAAVDEVNGLSSTAFLESGVYNVRASLSLLSAVAAGSTITLPVQYFPKRNTLYLTYGGSVCSPLGLVSGTYAYEEIGNDPNQPSDQVRLHFEAEAGATIDVWVVTSALGKNLDIMEALVADATGEADRAEGEADRAHNEAERLFGGFNANLITEGTVDLARLPAAALERLKKVTNDAARFALTTADVQNGDTVQTLDNGLMYRVVDDTQLNNANGYVVYVAGRAAAVDWSGVESRPGTFTPSSHAATHKGGGADAIDGASQSVAGLMSAADKAKLDNIAEGAQVNPTLSGLGGASASDLATHTEDDSIHVTSQDKSDWNGAVSDLATHTGNADIHVPITWGTEDIEPGDPLPSGHLYLVLEEPE